MTNATQHQEMLRRRGAKGSYPAGDETRSRLIEVAIELFATHGFNAASTRDIAQQAGVRSPALRYYFGNKLGVYRACIEAVIDAIQRRLDPQLVQVREAMHHAVSTASLIQTFCQLQDGIIDTCFADRLGVTVTRLLAWEDLAGTPHDAKTLFREKLDEPMFDLHCRLISLVTGEPRNDPVVGVRHFLLFGGYATFFYDARRLSDSLNWKPDNPNDLERLKSSARQHAMLVLKGLSSLSPSRRPDRRNTSRLHR